MNWQHFRAILWLRWRIWWNQIKKGGIVQAAIMTILAGLAVLGGAVLLVVSFVMGQLFLAQASPIILMVLWDLVVIGFLIAWVAGLVTDLQRSEGLSLDKLIHLPVSLTGAFLMNYLTSLIGLRMIFFLPILIGLSLGLIVSKGPAMLLLVPLVAGFLLMVTAVTYQFQGWLASLMVNKRRRRLIIVIVTTSFIVLGQLPTILGNFYRGNSGGDLGSVSKKAIEAQRALDAKEITKEQFEQRQNEIYRAVDTFTKDPLHLDRISPAALFANVVLPPGWLPLGVMGLAAGNVLPALFGSLGMTLLGSFSLWRSYKTTVNVYTGRFTSVKKPAVMSPTDAAAKVLTLLDPPIDSSHPASPQTFPSTLLEKKLPGTSEHVSAIALAGFRSFLRAPEAILQVLTPIIMVLVFGGMILRNRSNIAEGIRPLIAFGAMAIVLLANQHIMGNQFGFDRNGFRVFVLSPARRKDILFGKNLTMAPLILGLGGIMAIMIQLLTPMRLDLFLAVIPQYISMYLVFCLVTNCFSILAPAPLASGVFRRSNFRGLTLLYNVGFMFLFPMILGPMFLPFGIERILEDLGWLRGMPVCLALSLFELAAVAFFYHFVLDLEGRWLQAREKKILEIVAAKAE